MASGWQGGGALRSCFGEECGGKVVSGDAEDGCLDIVGRAVRHRHVSLRPLQEDFFITMAGEVRSEKN